VQRSPIAGTPTGEDGERQDARLLGAKSALQDGVSDDGPEKDAPALVPAGMMGDRADVIFAAPEEISRFISAQC
jgi:hypothetical protein